MLGNANAIDLQLKGVRRQDLPGIIPEDMIRRSGVCRFCISRVGKSSKHVEP